MSTTSEVFTFDEIEYWPEIKLEILQKFARTKIVTARRSSHIYVDGFSGAGIYVSKTTGQEIPASLAIALSITPPYSEYHFVDLDSDRLDHLSNLASGRPNVHVHDGDYNDALVLDIFPRIRNDGSCQGLCLLDPCGLDLAWEVMRKAGSMGTIDMFVSVPVADENLNHFWKNPRSVGPAGIRLMDRFCGDDSWRHIVYAGSITRSDSEGKQGNESIASVFRRRLKADAGFKNVPKPLPLRNSRGAIVYYLFFASASEDTTGTTVKEIFRKYREAW